MEKVKRKIPHIICSLVFIVKQNKINIDKLSFIKDRLVKIETFKDCYEITTNKIDVYEWYLEDVLSILFREFGEKKFKEYLDLKSCEVLLDIEIWRADRYPSIIFSKDNMKEIRKLKADISIDMYG